MRHVGALHVEPRRIKIHVHLGIARLGGVGLNPCQDGLGHLFRGELSIQPFKMLKLGPKKSAKVSVCVGGGVQVLFGQ